MTRSSRRRLAECQQPGASVAAVLLAHGLNVNLVRKWLVGKGVKRTDADRAPVEADIHIELQRGETRLTVQWPGET